MSVVGVQWFFIGNHQGCIAFGVPGIVVCPLGIAGILPFPILEVAVLNELGIQTTVGSIAQVLEEDPYEAVADALGTGNVGVHGHMQRLQVDEPYCILMGMFLI